MRLLKFLGAMLILTSLSLAYIQLQVQIFDLAYQGKHRETELQKLMDTNGHMAYKISALTSSNHLGFKLLTDNSNMQFLDAQHIVRLETPVVSTRARIASNASMRKSNFLAGIFTLKSQAEAGPIK